MEINCSPFSAAITTDRWRTFYPNGHEAHVKTAFQGTRYGSVRVRIAGEIMVPWNELRVDLWLPEISCTN